MIQSRSFTCGLTAALLLLSGCGEPERDSPPPSPAIYELSSADGAVEGWLLGTIHALPDGTQWQTPAIRSAVAAASGLVVEVADLDDRPVQRRFAELAAAPGLPPIEQRLAADARPALAVMVSDGGIDPGDLQRLETWAVALALAQAVRHGDSANGVDRAVIAAFAGRPVRELEGAEFQLDLFDTLPEDEQRDLLASVVHDYQRWGSNPARLAQGWLAGDIERLADPAQSALLADPELRDILLTRRNAAWAPRIAALLRREPPLLIAVGAGHIGGAEGLAALLAAQGYTVRRMD